MTFTVVAHIFVIPYMEDGRKESKFHTVEAKDETEAEEKVNKHYENKTSEYSIDYIVESVEFFEHIG